MWHWGHLGRRNRKVIPACLVKITRERVTNKFRNYRGFLDNFRDKNFQYICQPNCYYDDTMTKSVS